MERITKSLRPIQRRTLASNRGRASSCSSTVKPVIDSLRFSGFVNGLDRDSSDPLFRRYYVVPVAFPSGWTGVTAPIALTVTSTSRAEVGIVELWRSGGGDGGGELETTGARATGIAAGAALLLGLGALLVLRRRRDAAEAGARR